MDTSKLIAWSLFAACLFMVGPPQTNHAKDEGKGAAQAVARTPPPAALPASPKPVHTARAEKAAPRTFAPERRIGG